MHTKILSMTYQHKNVHKNNGYRSCQTAKLIRSEFLSLHI